MSLPFSACHRTDCDDTSMCVLLWSSISSRGTQQQQTLQHFTIFIISCIAVCPVARCFTISITVTHQSSVTSTSIFCSLYSLVVVLCWLLQGKLVMPLLPFLSVWLNVARFWRCWRAHAYVEVVKRICLLQNHSPLSGTYLSTLFTAILSQWFMDTYWCTCIGPVFQIAENSYSYWLHNS
jgi:hypothetical protein